MGDIFKEQMVKRGATAADAAKRAGLVLAFVLVCAVVILSPLAGVFPIVALGAGFGVYVLMGRFNVEFEYIFTNGDLDIDAIYGRNSRKRVFSGDVKTDAVEIMVPLSERGYDGQFSPVKIKKDCSSGKPTPDSYRILVNYKMKRMEIIFQPNDALLAAMSPYLGQRKLIKKK